MTKSEAWHNGERQAPQTMAGHEARITVVIRVLFAAGDAESLALMRATLDAALGLTPLAVQMAEVRTGTEVLERVDAQADDVIFLDWQLAGAGTPTLVREILDHNPLVRVVILLSEPQRQYRQVVWDAGACSSIPKEHLDQEWLSTVLCLISRAMQRENRGQAAAGQGDS